MCDAGGLWQAHTEVTYGEGLSTTVCPACRHEVAMVVGLTSYLLKQGYAPGEITVLTPYLKQLFDIRVCFTPL